ncbi:MAG: FAD-dependent thymidylate synthase, partial [Candidatus Taylorbacteria bacterium]|nr:FAD-dependent thymidylate synthase [Candidatus Taylorbacteria bacterium]
MQALYSRSADSVEVHVEKVKTSGSGKFMERFYVGYGHASIADCGSTTIFVEGISMLVAKAIQDWPLYSGQETSSRYIDMSKQAIIDPVATKESKAILDKWMKFYTENHAEVKENIIKKYPRKDGEDEVVYSKAVTARAFDTLRGFLPAGVATQFSWHTNLRQAHDKLVYLRRHPLAEVREVADKILASLKEKYAQSFGHIETPEQDKYWNFIEEKYNYYFNKNAKPFSFKTNINKKEIVQYKDIFIKRAIRSGLPVFLSELGNVTFEFLLDFGSFRDVQRHRNGVCRMPLLTTKYGFNEWYLNELPENVRKIAEKLIKEQVKTISKLKTTPENKQYYCAMGFNVACKVTYGLPAATYVAELRSGRLVHPTLRKIAHLMSKSLIKMFPFIKLQSDFSLDDWNIRRGMQDIKEK